MQSLAARHEDRARRIAMNRAERGVQGATNPAISVGSVAIAFRQFMMLYSRLDENSVKEFEANAESIKAEFAGGYRSLAEAPDGSGDTMAGIGVVNTAVVPSAVLAKSDDGKGASISNDPAWGETAPVVVDGLPEAELGEGDNLNGAALNEQLGENGGWGTTTPTTKPPEEAESGNGGGGEQPPK